MATERCRPLEGGAPAPPPPRMAQARRRRRSPRAALTLALLLVALLPACSERPAIPADVLIIGQQAEPKSLDPHAATSLNDFRIAANIYDGLVRFHDGTLEIEPALAESWEISADGRTYAFTLRDGIRFHDGSPLNAEAIRFNFERMLNEDHPYHDTGPFPLAFFFSSIESIETPDERTVVFHLDEPFAPFLSNLAYPTGFIVSPTAVKKYGSAFGRNPSGTGPFVFDRWESNRLVEIRRSPDAWDGAAKLERVIFRPLTQENARLTELLAGGVDMVMEVPPDVVAFFRKNPDFEVLEAAGPHLWFLILNTREGPFQDKRVRKAVNYAINKQTLVSDLLQDTATIPAGPIPEAFAWAANPDVTPYPYDPERARELIREAGAEGAEITFYATEGGSGMLSPKQMAAAIQADLADIGLDARIETFEWNTFLSRVNEGLEGRADMAEMAWMVNDPDTLPFLALRSGALPSEGGFNSGYYSNPEVDELIEAARRETDQAERAVLYRRIQQIVHDDAPWVFVASWKQNAVATDRLRGLELQPSFLLLLKNAWKIEATGDDS